jgi:peptide chain release factor 1
MQASLLRKLETLVERRTELDGMLAVPEVINDQDRYRSLSREHAEISPVVECFDRYRRTQDAIAHAEELMREDDAEMRALAQEEAQEARESLGTLEIESWRSAPAPAATRRACSPATCCACTALRGAPRLEGRGDVASRSEAELGGYKEVIATITGKGVYAA